MATVIRSRPEALIVSFGLVVIVIVLFYCAWRIQITQQWLYDHRQYIQSRDERWEAAERRIEETQILILEHIRREESRWEEQP